MHSASVFLLLCFSHDPLPADTIDSRRRKSVLACPVEVNTHSISCIAGVRVGGETKRLFAFFTLKSQLCRSILGKGKLKTRTRSPLVLFLKYSIFFMKFPICSFFFLIAFIDSQAFSSQQNRYGFLPLSLAKHLCCLHIFFIVFLTFLWLPHLKEEKVNKGTVQRTFIIDSLYHSSGSDQTTVLNTPWTFLTGIMRGRLLISFLFSSFIVFVRLQRDFERWIDGSI